MVSNWDDYFMRLCDTIASDSKCLSRKVGVVIVRDRKYIVATGYNGPPSSYPHCGRQGEPQYIICFPDDVPTAKRLIESTRKCPRKAAGYKSGEGLWLCPATHGEQNAVAIAAKYGISIKDCTLYLNTVPPCRECAKVIINAGIKEVVAHPGVYPEIGVAGIELLATCGVTVRYY